jgi:hypothetical protein
LVVSLADSVLSDMFTLQVEKKDSASTRTIALMDVESTKLADIEAHHRVSPSSA